MQTITLPVAVYRFFDADDRLLYVGVTDSLGTRFGAHRNSAWWPLAVRNTIQWHDTRHEALAAEYEAITTERPIYNVADAPFVMPTAEDVANLPLVTPGPPKPRRPRGTGSLHYSKRRNLWIARINFGWTSAGKQDIREASSRDKATAERRLAEIIAEKKAEAAA